MDTSKLVAGIALTLLFGSAVTHSAPPLPGKPWIMPFDVDQRFPPSRIHPSLSGEPSQREVYEFAWRSFIALNWPYKENGLRGQPDPKARLAPITNLPLPDDLVVWETYMSPETVFVPPQQWPVHWGKPDTSGLVRISTPPCYNGNYQYGTSFAPGINQPYTSANVPTGPVVDQHKEYLRVEVTLGRSYFDYIKQFGYFDSDTQEQAVRKYIRYANRKGESPPPAQSPSDNASRFQPVPTGLEFYLDQLPLYARQGLTEVKAAWKVLKLSGENPDIPGRYFRRLMRFPLPDGSLGEPVLMGLVGFHIHRVTPFGHLPSTFEQVDNVRIGKRLFDPLPKPKHPTLNPGGTGGHPARYDNGYEVNGESGVAGVIPLPYKDGEQLIPVDERERINVSRVTPIPLQVQLVNWKYQTLLRDSVWSYYQLIGAQNKNLESPNPRLGPGISGPQTSNTQNLVNTTLETYTQRGFSCARCHLNAFPQGVTSFPPYENRFEDLHVMSFLLLNAKSGSNPAQDTECSSSYSALP